MEYSLKSEHDDIHKFVNDLYSNGIQRFEYSVGIEGFKQFTFGCSAGSSIRVESLAHELAHLVELPKNKRRNINEFGWGFKSTKIILTNQYGSFHDDPKTTQITERECRVVAIEKHIIELSGNKVNEEFIYEYSEILEKFMPDHVSSGLSKKWIQNNYDEYIKQDIHHNLIESLKYITKRRIKFLSQ